MSIFFKYVTILCKCRKKSFKNLKPSLEVWEMFPNGFEKLPRHCTVKIVRMFLISEKYLRLWLHLVKHSHLGNCLALVLQ